MKYAKFVLKLLLIGGGAAAIGAWGYYYWGENVRVEMNKVNDMRRREARKQGTKPLGVRNNNPGNIRSNALNWLGKVGESKGFVVFDSPEHGFRAMARVLAAYARRGITSIPDIINTWAPPSDNNLHNDNYVRYVERRVEGLEGEARQSAMMLAMADFENGQGHFTQKQANKGLELA